jgi:hypothetical protein
VGVRGSTDGGEGTDIGGLCGVTGHGSLQRVWVRKFPAVGSGIPKAVVRGQGGYSGPSFGEVTLSLRVHELVRLCFSFREALVVCEGLFLDVRWRLATKFCGGGGFGCLLRLVFFVYSSVFLDPLDFFLLGKKRFWTRYLRSTLGACGVLVNTLRSFGSVRC